MDSLVLEEIASAGGVLYYIGGCVRDKIMGNENTKDTDVIIVGLSIEDIEIILSKHGNCTKIGNSFPVLKYNDEIDVTIPRIERSTGPGHKDFVVETGVELTLEQDVERRDFTINSIAMKPDGTIIDLLDGIKDIKNKVIRAIKKGSFEADPLRIMRAIQFSARFGFGIEEETRAEMKMCVPLLKFLPPERIKEELEKALPYPYPLYTLLTEFVLPLGPPVPRTEFGYEFSFVEFILYCYGNTKFFQTTKKEKRYIDTMISLTEVSKLSVFNALCRCDELLHRPFFRDLLKPEFKECFADFVNKKIPCNLDGLCKKGMTREEIEKLKRDLCSPLE